MNKFLMSALASATGAVIAFILINELQARQLTRLESILQRREA